MGDAGDAASGKLTLYTNHACPWAHRAHIAIHELGLQYDEVVIDLEKPREEWYLEINDRGLVPTLQQTNKAFGSSEPVTIIESALVVQYLIDAFPHRSSHILPAAEDPKSAYDRYRINLLVDTWFSKVGPLWFKALVMTGTDEATTKADELFEAIKQHIEPLLAAALREGPFMGGSQRLTLGEILTGPFVLRIHDFSNSNGAVHPQSLAEKLNTLPAYSKWSKAVASHESVTYIWRKEDMIKAMQRRAPDMRKKYGIAK